MALTKKAGMGSRRSIGVNLHKGMIEANGGISTANGIYSGIGVAIAVGGVMSKGTGKTVGKAMPLSGVMAEGGDIPANGKGSAPLLMSIPLNGSMANTFASSIKRNITMSNGVVITGLDAVSNTMASEDGSVCVLHVDIEHQAPKSGINGSTMGQPVLTSDEASIEGQLRDIIDSHIKGTSCAKGGDTKFDELTELEDLDEFVGEITRAISVHGNTILKLHDDSGTNNTSAGVENKEINGTMNNNSGPSTAHMEKSEKISDRGLRTIHMPDGMQCINTKTLNGVQAIANSLENVCVIKSETRSAAGINSLNCMSHRKEARGKIPIEVDVMTSDSMVGKANRAMPDSFNADATIPINMGEQQRATSNTDHYHGGLIGTDEKGANVLPEDGNGNLVTHNAVGQRANDVHCGHAAKQNKKHTKQNCRTKNHEPRTKNRDHRMERPRYCPTKGSKFATSNYNPQPPIPNPQPTKGIIMPPTPHATNFERAIESSLGRKFWAKNGGWRRHRNFVVGR